VVAGNGGHDDHGPEADPLDPRDFSRRTLLANERTYLAWWRTALTLLTVALATARVVPELAKTRVQWPYTTIGVACALLGALCALYGERRRAEVSRAVREGGFAEPSAAVTAALAIFGALLGIAIAVLILADA
jgi:putative membrane protein